jgi:hypothetical protein
MKTIHKFHLRAARITLALPKVAVVLGVHLQRDEPMIWALVDTEAPKESRTFETFGTGYELPQKGLGRFVGTFLTADETFVWHVFEMGDGLAPLPPSR